MSKFHINLHNCPRIVILGNNGSGKSTLAREIAARTGHPLLHLDYIYWRTGWLPSPADEFRAAQEQFMKQPHWIIDGMCTSVAMEQRFFRASAVIFLDLPPLLCVLRLIRRNGKPRPDLQPEVHEPTLLSKDEWKFITSPLRFRSGRARKIWALHAKYPQISFLHIKSKKQLRLLLEVEH